MENQPWLRPIGNQTWNLKRFGSQASHMRWGHGAKFKKYPAIPYWRFTYPVMATPIWLKAGLTSFGLRTYENFNRDE